MKICKILYYHDPLDGRIFFKEALSLKKAGHDLTLLLPLYDEKLYNSNQEIALNEDGEANIQGIKIKVLKLKKNNVPILGYLLTIYFYTKALVSAAIKLQADVYHCHDHKIALFGFLALIKKIKKTNSAVKFVFDVHEYHPGQNKDYYKNYIRYLFFNGWMNSMDKKAVKYIDHFIAVSEATRIHYLSLNRYINIDIITNLSSKEIFSFDKNAIEKKDVFTLCHEGNLSFNRGLKEIAAIIKLMKENNYIVHLKIIGSIPLKEQKWLNKYILTNKLEGLIHDTGWVPYNRVGQEISDCHVGLVTMKPLYNNIFSISNKFFNYLLYGLPVVAIKSPEMSRIIEENQCGLTYNFDDFGMLYEQVLQLYKNSELYIKLSRNAFSCTERYFNWKHAENKLLNIYSNFEKNKLTKYKSLNV